MRRAPFAIVPGERSRLAVHSCAGLAQRTTEPRRRCVCVVWAVKRAVWKLCEVCRSWHHALHSLPRRINLDKLSGDDVKSWVQTKGHTTWRVHYTGVDLGSRFCG